eukprot:jgi/Botrbrau1/846/Bobra.0352s0040.1
MTLRKFVLETLAEQIEEALRLGPPADLTDADEGLAGSAAVEALEVAHLSVAALSREGGGLRPAALRIIPLLFRLAWLGLPSQERQNARKDEEEEEEEEVTEEDSEGPTAATAALRGSRGDRAGGAPGVKEKGCRRALGHCLIWLDGLGGAVPP